MGRHHQVNGQDTWKNHIFFGEGKDCFKIIWNMLLSNRINHCRFFTRLLHGAQLNKYQDKILNDTNSTKNVSSADKATQDHWCMLEAFKKMPSFLKISRQVRQIRQLWVTYRVQGNWVQSNLGMKEQDSQLIV